MPEGDFVWGGWRKPYQYILGEAEDKYATFFKGMVAPMKLNKGKKYKLGDILVTIKSSGELYRSGDYSHYGVSYQVEFPHPRNARNTIQGYLSMAPNGGFRLNVGGVVIIRAESGGFGMAQKTSEYDWFLNHYRGSMGESVESIEVSEAKRQPEATYFPSYTAALNAARAKAEKEGYQIDENDWDTRVTHGYPGRPAEGETTNVKIGLSRVGKGGKPEAAVLVIAVYGMKQSFELTSYISKVPMGKSPKRVRESVEVTEAKQTCYLVWRERDKNANFRWGVDRLSDCSDDASGKRVGVFQTREAAVKFVKNKGGKVVSDRGDEWNKPLSDSVKVTEAAYNTIQVHPAYRDDDKGWYITHTDAKGGNQVWGPFASITEAKKAAKKYAERYGAAMKEESEVGIDEKYYRKAGDTNICIPAKWQYEQFFKMLKSNGKHFLFNQLKAEEAYERAHERANPRSSVGDVMDEAERIYMRAMELGEPPSLRSRYGRAMGFRESVEVGIEEAETMPSESDLRAWYKATGAVPPFAGAVPSYKLLKKMFLRDKKQKNKAWEIWQDLVKKGTVSEG